MRKIFSVIMGVFICFWGSIGSILALGENKVEIFKDGTVLHYISTERLDEAISKYKTYEKDVHSYRERVNGHVGVRIFAGAAGFLGYLGLSLATRGTSWQDSSIVLFGKIIIVSLAAAGVIYPDYRDWQENRAYQTAYGDIPEAIAYFNSHSNLSIYASLTGVKIVSGQDPDRFNNGAVVVLRPFDAKDQILSTGVWDVNELEKDGRLHTLKDHLKDS